MDANTVKEEDTVTQQTRSSPHKKDALKAEGARPPAPLACPFTHPTAGASPFIAGAVWGALPSKLDSAPTFVFSTVRGVQGWKN